MAHDGDTFDGEVAMTAPTTDRETGTIESTVVSASAIAIMTVEAGTSCSRSSSRGTAARLGSTAGASTTGAVEAPIGNRAATVTAREVIVAIVRWRSVGLLSAAQESFSGCE